MLERSVDEARIPGLLPPSAGKAGLPQWKPAVTLLCSRGKPMRVDTVFDIASVTKVVVTTSAVMLTMEQGLLCLDDPVKSIFLYLPADIKISLRSGTY